MESTAVTLTCPGTPPEFAESPARVAALRRERVAVYFVASPLQYLAAREIAARHEAGARQVLVWYQPGLHGIVRTAAWDIVAWNRAEEMPKPEEAPKTESGS